MTGMLRTRRELLAAATAGVATAWGQSAPDLELFFRLFDEEGTSSREAMRALQRSWKNSYATMVVELARVFMEVSRVTGGGLKAESIRERVLGYLMDRTRQGFGMDLRAWNRWAWALPYDPHPRYGEFKGLVYALLDRRMRDFFPAGVRSDIRLDQVEWGGVTVNGIPPLVNPAMLRASEASYLKDSHVVFGIESGGAAKAYPKRILAWHEMALDRVGELDLAIVYCTLCGTVIPYLTSVGGRRFTFGTSGLLYESSKLMFDAETKSLWPTLQGQPMIGALAGSGLQLRFAPVVTTTWGEWRAERPETLVLSPATGHQRDYGEGVAYRDYFATQELMFEVSKKDSRLKPKDEVLAIRLAGKRPLAIAVKLLDKRREFAYRHEGVELVIRSTPGGANRVFSAASGERIEAHRAFWFGWFTQNPDTVLVAK